MKYWDLTYIKKMLYQNRQMNIFSFLAIFLSFLSMLLTGEVVGNLQQMTMSAYQNYYHAQKLSLSRKENSLIEGTSLSLVKISRPDINEMASLKKFLPQLNYDYNISAFFPQFLQVQYQNKKQKIECVSLKDYAENKSLLGQDYHFTTLNEVIVNRECAEALGLTLNQEVVMHLESQNIISFQQEKMGINFHYNLHAVVKFIVEEFSFMNNPRIYYSYDYAKRFLKENYCLEIYSRFNQKVSYFSLIKNSQDYEEISAFSFFIFPKSFLEGQAIYDFFLQENMQQHYEISGFAFQIKDSLKATTLATSTVAEIFSLILIGITMAIIIFASLYNYERNKKNTSIFASLGIKNQRLIFINVLPNILLTILASLMSGGILLAFSEVLNEVLFSLLSFTTLFRVSTFIPRLCGYSLVAILMTFLINYFLLKYKLTTNDLASSLKEE